MINISNFFRFANNLSFQKLFSTIGLYISSDFYQNYLTDVEQIKEANVQFINKIRLKQLSLVLVATNYALLYLLHDYFNLREHILHVNWLVLDGFPSWINIFGAVFVLFTAQVLSIVYFKNNKVVFSILKAFFLNRSSSVGISKTVTGIFHFRSTPTPTTSSSLFDLNSASYTVETTLFGYNLKRVLTLKHFQLFVSCINNFFNIIRVLLCKFFVFCKKLLF